MIPSCRDNAYQRPMPQVSSRSLKAWRSQGKRPVCLACTLPETSCPAHPWLPVPLLLWESSSPTVACLHPAPRWQRPTFPCPVRTPSSTHGRNTWQTRIRGFHTDGRVGPFCQGGAVTPGQRQLVKWPSFTPKERNAVARGVLRFLQMCCPPWWTSTAMAHSLAQGAATAWCYRVLKRHRPSSPQVPSFTGVSESYSTSEQVGVVCPRVLASSGPRELPRRPSASERDCLPMQASFTTDFLMVRGHLTRKAIRFFEVV